MSVGHWPVREPVDHVGKTRITVNFEEQWVPDGIIKYDDIVDLARLKAGHAWQVEYVYVDGGASSMAPGGAIDVRKDMLITVRDGGGTDGRV